MQKPRFRYNHHRILQTLFDHIKALFMKSVNNSYQTNNLIELQTQGLKTVLPKPEKDLEFLSNWRPIYLLNIDYK